MTAQQHRLSLHLMKGSVKDFADVLREDIEYEELALREDLPFEGKLFVQFDRQRPPSWLTLLRDAVAEELEAHANVSNAAVLVIKRSYGDEDRLFAIPFGYGRHMVDDQRYVRDFGLKVTLNAIDHDELISVDVHTLEELPFHRRVQASRAAPPSEFELDSHRDMLRSVTGRPSDGSANRLSGRDAVAVSIRLDVDDLATFCDEYYEAYAGTRYRDRFGWIDELGEVRDPVLLDELDQALIHDLRQGAGSAWIASPELLDWTEVEGFWIWGTGRRRQDQVLEEPSLDWYLERLSPDGISVEKLKRDRLEAFRTADGAPAWSWSVYHSLISEMDRDDELYVLINGTWFRIARSLLDEVNDFVSDLEASDLGLPESRPGEHEGDYNRRAGDVNEQLFLLDKVLVSGSPTEGTVEACDLFRVDGVFVHVKRYKRGSADLSHLFAQAAVSAIAFLREPVFRTGLREALVGRGAPQEVAETVVPDGRPAPSDYEIAYAIIAPDWPDGARSLPFFAKLTLSRAARELLLMGFAVTLTRVPVEMEAQPADEE